ncbi:thioesterase family protein [candidate division KSB1 bacterium]|nr:thioesterase family protein [candidate division KSB1 bacterium]
MPFVHTTKVQLYHTDSAGILFYSKIFELAFEAFDAFLAKCGTSVSYILTTADFTMPFVHAQADYLLSLVVGDVVKIVIKVDKIGDSSFALLYHFLKEDQTVGRVKTIHVTVSKETGQKIPLPGKIRRGLELCASD